MKTSILAAAVLVVAAGALAAPPQEQPAEPAAQPEKKVCRTEKATGSLTRRTRICLTPTQWREVNNRTRNGIDRFVGDASGGCMAPARGGTMCGG